MLRWVFQVLIDADRPSRHISRASAKHLVDRMTGAFEPRSVVCLHLLNDIQYVPLVLAILASGAVWTGTNPTYTATELADHLSRSEARYVLVEERDLATALEATSGCRTCRSVVLVGDLVAGSGAVYCPTVGHNLTEVVSLSELVARKRSYTLAKASPSASGGRLAALMSTSGTTGLPKLACRTHHAMLLESHALLDDGRDKDYTIRRLFCTPVFHAFSLILVVVNALRYGHRTYMMKKFDPTFRGKVYNLGITETAVTPAILHRLVNVHEEAMDRLKGLRLVWCAGTPLFSDLRSRASSLLQPDARIVQVWGMTEGGWFTTLRYPEESLDDSVGRPLDGLDIRVSSGYVNVDLPHQTAGELLVRGSQLMAGYFNDSSATAQAFEGGWLKTGDLGYIRGGKVYLIDRVKSMIKVNGFQVSPAELEGVIRRCPQVLDCAVIRCGSGLAEHPLVSIVAESACLTEPDVRGHMLLYLARYKVTACCIRFIDAIPRGTTGKVLTRELLHG